MNIEYALALALSAMISATMAVVAWRRRAATGATGLTISMLAFTVWTLTYAIRWTTADRAAEYFWLDATYLGVVSTPPALLIFALQFTNREHLLTRRNLILLVIEPCLTLLFLFTDPLHGLFYAGMRTTGTILNGGPWFWINVVYSYIINLVIVGLFVQAFLRAPLFYRRQTGTLLIGMLLPFIGNVISLAKLSPFSNLDITPFVFIITGLVFGYGLFRYRLFDIVPVARSKVVESMSDGVIVLDLQRRIVDINPVAHRIVGTSENWIGKPAAAAFGSWSDLGETFLSTGETQTELRIASDPPRDFEARASALFDERRHPAGWLIILRDITKSKQVAEALQKSEAHFRSVVQTAMDAIITVEGSGNIVAWNRGAQQIFQYTETEMMGQPLSILIPERYREQHRAGMGRLSAGNEPHIVGQTVQVYGLHKDGTEFPIELVLSFYKVNNEVFFSGIIRDITERRQLELALQYQSNHDSLTGLFNRQYYEAEIERLQQSRQFPISILMMDLDSLKRVNDTLGHNAGDELLRRTAQILKRAFRPEDLVARIGGDEFVVILPNADVATTMQVVQRLKNKFAGHNQHGAPDQAIQLSIGFACGTENSLLSEVFKQADAAMYLDKAQKKEPAAGRE